MGEGALTQEDIETLIGDSIVKSIKGMAIEVSRLSEEDKKWLLKNHNHGMSAIQSVNEKFNVLGAYNLGGLGCYTQEYYADMGFTITDSPQVFMEYVAQQTGKKYVAKKFLENFEPDETKINLGIESTISKTETVYPHKTYRILDSLDGIPLDKRFKLSEWIPPFGVDVCILHANGSWNKGSVNGIFENYIEISEEGYDDSSVMWDGHWMRIV